MNRQDKFLVGVLIFIILGFAGLTSLGLIQYQNDSKRFQDSHQEQDK